MERACKWFRRNPRALPFLGMTLAVLALIGTGIGLVRAGIAQRREEAVNQSRIFPERMPGIRVALNTVHQPADRDAGIHDCRELLDKYGVLTNPRWREDSRVRSLEAGKRRELIEEIGGHWCCWGVPSGARQNLPGTTEKIEVAREVQGLQKRAIECFEGTKLPGSFWRQAAEIAGVLGDSVAQQSALEQMKSATLNSARDYYLEGTDALLQGHEKEATELLEEAIARKPDHYPAHFSCAYANEQMREYPLAMTHYRIAAALQTDDYRSNFNRGTILCLQAQYPKAEREYDKAIAIKPSHGESLSGIARSSGGGRKNYTGAIEDLDRALELGVSALAVSLLQAECYDGLHQLKEAIGFAPRGRQAGNQRMKVTSWYVALVGLPPMTKRGEAQRTLKKRSNSTLVPCPAGKTRPMCWAK